jgi:hypothetical protein
MSNHTDTHNANPADPLESIIHSIPVIIPLAGGLMIFLLAFIAVFMAGLAQASQPPAPARAPCAAA